jgi:FkbM family methyltransferase
MALPPLWTSAYVITYAFRESRRDERELAWLASRLPPEAVFVDVGANLGQWTLPVATHVGPNGRVVAIEPAAATAAALARSIRLNGLTRAEVVRVAASDLDGMALLHHHDRDPSQHSLGHVGPAAEEVHTRALDSLLAELEVDRLDAVKIDVEGAEEIVLRGSSRMLSELRPIVIFEVRKGLPERLGLEVDGAWRLTLGAGYRSYRLDDGGSLLPMTPEMLSGHVRGWNIIALPIETADGITDSSAAVMPSPL